MTRLWRPVLALALLLALGGCSRGETSQSPAASGYMVDVTLDPSMYTVGPVTALISVLDREGKGVSGAQVELEATMSHAGMVPVLAQATEIEPGRYEAPFEWTMAGDWILYVTVTLSDGQVVKHEVQVAGVREP